MVVCFPLLKVQILGLNELATLVIGVVTSSCGLALGASRVRVVSERRVVGLVDELVSCCRQDIQSYLVLGLILALILNLN